MNLENQILRAIKHDKQYCREQLSKEENPHVRQKIEKYLDELNAEETKILEQHNILKDEYDKPTKEPKQ
jgi:hypothetical protein